MTSTRLRYSWITAQQDRTEHAVSDDEQAAASHAAGWFMPVCGERFIAAPMEAAASTRCLKCRQYLLARANMRTLDERLNRPSWLSRLCHRRRPSGVGGGKTTRNDGAMSAGVQPSACAGGAPEGKQGLSSPAPAGAHRRRGGRHAA